MVLRPAKTRSLFGSLCDSPWPGASYLQLLPEGFVACSLFRHWE